jgi:hypothetical protein
MHRSSFQRAEAAGAAIYGYIQKVSGDLRINSRHEICGVGSWSSANKMRSILLGSSEIKTSYGFETCTTIGCAENSPQDASERQRPYSRYEYCLRV